MAVGIILCKYPFKHTNKNIAFKNINTIQQYTKAKTIVNKQDYTTSRIYELPCNTCKMSHIGQTSRNLNQRYWDHIRYVRNNLPTHSIYYKIYTNTDLLQTLCPYSNPYIRLQC